MHEMKDSGVEWIEKIPKEWKTNKLKYMFVFGKGLSITKNDLVEAGMPVLSYGQIHAKSNKGTSITQELIRYIPQNLIPDNVCLIHRDGFIFADTSEDLDGCGNCAYVDLKEGIYAGYHTITLSPKLACNTKYLAYLFSTSVWRKQIRSKVNGIKVYSITQKILKNCTILFPPINIQSQIVDYLDSKCLEIDKIQRGIETEIETLKEYKKSVIAEAVTKGLDPDVEMKDSGIPWIGGIPKNWEIMPNKYLMHKVKKICPVYNGENILSLTIQGVIIRDFDLGGKMPATFDGYQIIYPGNLLMCLFDYDVTPRCIGLIKDKGLTSPAYSQFVMNQGADARYYYYYYLLLDFTKELLHLAKNLRHSFTEEQLGKIKVPVPPIEEQHRIVDFLDTKCARIDSIVEDKQKQISTLDEYKKSLIYEYVTGKKEVPSA